MTVSVTDTTHISVLSSETIPANSFFKTYNFFGWIESTLVAASPQYTWAVNVYDTCAAYYEMVWSTFASANINIGSGTGDSQIKAFTQTLKSGKTITTALDCGEGTFEIILSDPTSAKSIALGSLISVTATGTQPI